MNELRFEYPAFLKIVRYKLDNWTQQETRTNQLFYLNDHINQRSINKYRII